MKAVIIYNSSNSNSVKNANSCYESFIPFSSWNVELYDGYTPNNLPCDEYPDVSVDTRSRFPVSNPWFIYKKACFFSHFVMWKRCVDLNQTIMIVEHDTECIADIPENMKFNDGITLVTTESMFQGFNRYRDDRLTYSSLPNGSHSIRMFNPHGAWGYIIPGNTGYVITPKAASILIKDCKEYGWQQNDVLMNDDLVPVFCLKPSIIKYCPDKELQTSRGN